MNEYLIFAVLGLGSGAIYAAIGSSLVITFAGTGVINFAAAAMASVGLFPTRRQLRWQLPLNLEPLQASRHNFFDHEPAVERKRRSSESPACRNLPGEKVSVR